MAVKKSKRTQETEAVAEAPVVANDTIIDADIDKLNTEEAIDNSGESTASSDEVDEIGSESSYSSDDSEDEDQRNKIGSVPLRWYEGADHIGYDMLGRKIIKSLKSNEVDELLKSTQDPNNWRTIKDVKNDREVLLSASDIEIIRRLRSGIYPHSNLQETFAEFATTDAEHPLVHRDKPKSSFLPCKWENKEIRRLVKLIRSGQLLPPAPPKKTELFDIWATDNSAVSNRGLKHVPAPKPALPDHAESYHPPQEYLPSEEDKALWQSQDWSLRAQNFLPQSFACLRHVPFYARSLNERFERCLDLFTLPRKFKMKMNVDPESLIPQLPPQEDLRPFPTGISVVTATAAVAIAPSPCGEFLLCAGALGVTLVDMMTGKGLWSLHITDCTCIAWGPQGLIAVGDKDGYVYMFTLPAPFSRTEVTLPSGGEWLIDGQTAKIKTNLDVPVSKLAWHHKGNYLASVSHLSGSLADSLFIHSVGSCKTLKPLGNKGASALGKVTDVSFHAQRPWLVVTGQRSIRILDLKRQATEKVLSAGNSSRQLSALSVHPGGNHLVAVSGDRRLVWFDLDLGVRPWRVLRHFQDKSMTKVLFHPRLPLLAVASEDGTAQVFHAKVFEEDLSRSPLLVPVSRLLAGSVTSDLCWHPHQPWLITAAADGNVKLWA